MFVQQLLSLEAPPSPLSSRPELRRSGVERSAVSAVLSWKCFSTGEVMGRWPPTVMKNVCPATTLAGSAALPFVISTGAPKERSGEICGVSGPFLEMFFDRRSHGPLAAHGDEKRLSSNYSRWKRRPPLCHLDRSSEGAEWRDLRCQRSFPGNVFRPEKSWAVGRPRVMEKRFSSNYCRWKRRPPLCHLDRSAAQWRDLRCQRSFPGNVFRPEKSWPFGPPKVMKNGSCSATTLNGSAALPFVISTGAPKERSGEICGFSGPSLGMFRPEESWAFGPPKAMKNGSCSATTVNGSAALPFVISTGAQRSGEICGVSGPSLGNVFRPEKSWP